MNAPRAAPATPSARLTKGGQHEPCRICLESRVAHLLPACTVLGVEALPRPAGEVFAGQRAPDLLVAAKMGDDAKFKATNDACFANADQIAHFLTDANPQFWPIEATMHLMHTH